MSPSRQNQINMNYVHCIFNNIGGKSVKKAMAKITKGTLKSEGNVWFTELSDKGKGLIMSSYILLQIS